MQTRTFMHHLKKDLKTVGDSLDLFVCLFWERKKEEIPFQVLEEGMIWYLCCAASSPSALSAPQKGPLPLHTEKSFFCPPPQLVLLRRLGPLSRRHIKGMVAKGPHSETASFSPLLPLLENEAPMTAGHWLKRDPSRPDAFCVLSSCFCNTAFRNYFKACTFWGPFQGLIFYGGST